MYNANNGKSNTDELQSSSLPMPYLKRLVMDTGLFALSSFGSKFLVFFLAPLYTYVLSTEDYGIVDLIQTTVTLLYPVLTLCISDAVLRFAMDKEADHSKVLNMGFLLIVLSSAILACAYPLVVRILPDLQPVWFAFVAFYLLYNLQDCFGSYVKAIGKTKVFALMGILHTIVLICCSLVFLLVFHWNLKGYIASILISAAAAVGYLFAAGRIYEKVKHPCFDGRLLKEMLCYSLPLVPTFLSWSINANIDKYMIIAMYGIGDSGVYSIAHKIPSMLTVVLNIFLQAWQLNAISIRREASETIYYNSIYSATKTVCVFLSLVLILMSKPLTKWLFAPAYFEAWCYMPMLVLSALFSALSGFLAAPFRAYKNSKGLFISVGVGAGVNLLLNALLLPAIGVVGAAIATAVSFMIVWGVRICSVQKHVRIQWKWNEGVVYVILFAISAVVTFECPYAYRIFAVGCAGIVLLLKNEIAGILGQFIRAISAKNRR